MADTGMDDRVLVVNAVTETTTKNQPADAAFLWLLATQYNLNFPQVADPDQSLYDFATGTTINLPFHVAVDLRSMKIVLAKGGAVKTSDIEQLAMQTLLGPP